MITDKAAFFYSLSMDVARELYEINGHDDLLVLFFDDHVDRAWKDLHIDFDVSEDGRWNAKESEARFWGKLYDALVKRIEMLKAGLIWGDTHKLYKMRGKRLSENKRQTFPERLCEVMGNVESDEKLVINPEGSLIMGIKKRRIALSVRAKRQKREQHASRNGLAVDKEKSQQGAREKK